MKLHDITKFASKSKIKPDLTCVNVKHTEFGIIYVATDSFTLVEIEAEYPALKLLIGEGLYSQEKWKEVVKAVNKKNAVIEKGTFVADGPDDNYPDYDMLIPDSEDIVPITTPINRVDYKRYYAMCSFLDKYTGMAYMQYHKNIKQIKDKTCLYYEGEFIKIFLMGLD